MINDSNAFKAVLSFLRVQIDGELNGRIVVSEGYLADAVGRFGVPFSLNELDQGRLVKHLETIYMTKQEDGHLLQGSFKQWYPSAKASIDFHYWRRLEKHWKDNSVLPIEVVKSVDQVTDEIIGLLGNPKDKESWNRRRGLVMGHVQMGKTTNYSALISKAADAGYRIIIVLAGLTNSLRYQTQVRLDKTFVGKSSISDATHSKIYPVARVFAGERPDYVARHPYCGTSQLSDFNSAFANTGGAHEGNFADPILFVTKKNPKVLAKLAEWLSGLRQDQKLDGPMLLIDDEADNASVNTNENPNIATAINQCIRGILHTTKQSTYVGYTATPFANIFIDPDTTDGLDREDLFPADFIKSLDPPDNYVGASRLFGEDGDLLQPCVCKIPTDYADVLPVKHLGAWKVPRLPASLLDALREYVLARAVRISRGDGNESSAFLVNVSRFNAVQAQVRDFLDVALAELVSAIESWSMASWEQSAAMLELKRVWDREYEGTIELDWDAVRPYLKASVTPMETRLVNMKGGGIDYESAPPTGLHLIAVGGLALARGLTLDGLLVSYVLRNVGAADTLLQMGRWFGYRPGFENICRVHVTESLVGHFEEVSASVEELRADFQRMALLGKTPLEFGLKVRQSPTGISITASNKMRAATEISLAEDFSNRHVQAYSVYDSKDINGKNLDVFKTFYAKIGSVSKEQVPEEGNARVWTGVPVSEVVRLLKAFELPQTEFSVLEAGGASLIAAYIEDRQKTELASWDVAIPYVKLRPADGALPFEYARDGFGGQTYYRSRTSAVKEDDLVKITKKNAVAFGDDDLLYGEDRNEVQARADAIKQRAVDAKVKSPSSAVRLAMSRTRPLLVVHLLRLASKDKDVTFDFDPELPVVTLSLVFPGTGVLCRERRYHATPRLMQLLAERRKESESDEVLDDE
ncbi:Z1 domain protein [Caballeronia sordidicola]|uniref:Z1 domain protein n=1 Tax=Caballeronia sordidicola TaxID=196367 RepID=A0A158HGI8_CABSO|nr:Z1 domain-containing protein [Caballeronia sordidicola]SAL43081.1 Z1 domain protein [Caballeronia sordidicola]